MMRHSFHHGETKKRYGSQRRKTHEIRIGNVLERKRERMRTELETYENGCRELLVSIADYMQYGIKLPYKAS